MEINIWVVLGIIVIHWFADFVLQTEEMAQGKSKNWSDLLNHTMTYSLIWYVIGTILIVVNLNWPFFDYPSWALTKFVVITFIAHTATDYYTSRVNSMLWEKKEVHNFFVSIGFDQVLHYIQLFLTYQLLINY